MERTSIRTLIAGVVTLAIVACGGETTPDLLDGPAPTSEPNPAGRADVINVSISGVPGGYSLSVTVGSPDLGCSPYADWWEAISGNRKLLPRRVLLHAHVQE